MIEDKPIDPREMDADDFARLGIGRTSRGSAIRAMCLQCMGGSSHEVLLCASSPCPLWPFRCGTDPFREKREMTDEQRQAAADRFRVIRGRNAT